MPWVYTESTPDQPASTPRPHCNTPTNNLHLRISPPAFQYQTPYANTQHHNPGDGGLSPTAGTKPNHTAHISNPDPNNNHNPNIHNPPPPRRPRPLNKPIRPVARRRSRQRRSRAQKFKRYLPSHPQRTIIRPQVPVLPANQTPAKVCCIYHKPKAVGESSSESSSDSSSSGSDSESSGGGPRRVGAGNGKGKGKKAGGKKKHDCDGHDHDHYHDQDRRTGGSGSRRRSVSPNAYEKMPRYNAKKDGDSAAGGSGNVQPKGVGS